MGWNTIIRSCFNVVIGIFSTYRQIHRQKQSWYCSSIQHRLQDPISMQSSSMSELRMWESLSMQIGGEQTEMSVYEGRREPFARPFAPLSDT